MSKEGKQLEPEKQRKSGQSSFRLWTIETITAVMVVVGFLTLFIDTWEQVSIVPKKRVQSAKLEDFEKDRSVAFDNFRAAWTKMRIGFTPYLRECEKKIPDEAKLNQFRIQNEANIEDLKRVTSGTLDYYWGKSILQIIRYERTLYQNYLNVCPHSIDTEGLFVDREGKLMQLLLTKAYDPRKDDKYYDDPYYSNF